MDNEISKIIAEQAIEIIELKKVVKELHQRLSSINGILYSIGGPLNDNVLQYSKKQLSPFFRIADEVKG